MKDLTTYSDYRAYLRDYYETHKAVHPGFSYRYLAEKAGINSSSFYKLIIEGKRNLSKATILKTCLALKLKDEEAEYFENLVFFNQAKSVQEKSFYFDKIVSLQSAQKVPVIEKGRVEFFKDWHHCIIRELVAMHDFGEDYARLGSTLIPPIPAAKAEASVKMLLEMGFLKRTRGRYVQTEPILTTGFGTQEFQVIRHQIRMMQLAMESFERCRATERLVSSSTLGISKEGFLRLVKKLRDFRGHLMEVVQLDGQPEMVYQLNMSLIPMTQAVEPSK